MGIILAVFRIVRKLHIVPRYLDTWSQARCKSLVGVLLGPQDLLALRDEIILKISSSVAVITKESLFFSWNKNF